MPTSPRVPQKVGRIVGTHGLRGQLKIEVLTDFDRYFEKGRRLLLKGDWLEIAETKWHKGRPLVSLYGINSIDKAQPLQWEYLEAIPLADEELSTDEYRVADLVGLEVQTLEGTSLGKVDEVHAMPAQDVLQVGEVMLPLVKEFIKEIDLERGLIKVSLIPGMLGEEAE
jgi:16S rRNA processing protein RimM